MAKGQRGRPIGYRLSEESKRAIAESKKGQFHKQETKDKISKSLIIYFKQFNSLADEITNRYCRTDDDIVCDWANDAREDLDESESVLTRKSMRNKRRMEISFGNDIEFFSHNLTPETMVILKQLFIEHNGDIDKILKDL